MHIHNIYEYFTKTGSGLINTGKTQKRFVSAGTMEDYYRFAAALANGGAPPPGMPGRRFLSEESALHMTTNQLVGDTPTGKDLFKRLLVVQ